MLGFKKWIDRIAGFAVGSIASILLSVLVYEGVSLFGFPIIKGVVHERIESHDRKNELAAFARAREADDALGEREAARAEASRQQVLRDAQSRVDLAKGEAKERETFLLNQEIDRQRRITELENELSSRFAGNCQPKVITEYVQAHKPRICPYPGDTAPSASFLQQYRQLSKSPPG